MKNLLILLAFLLPFTVRCQDTIVVQKAKGQVVVIVDKEEAPIPPAPLLSVDNMDKNIVYSPAWTHNNTTTATGFYQNTIAYDATGGRTATLIFEGTSIEVFCEKKPGHGSGAFQVDSQAPVTIPLGVAGPTGSTSVFKVENLTSGQHTFKLTVVGSGNVVFDYVKINGVTVTPPVTPIPPIPPGNTVVVNPGQNLTSIVQSQPSGTTVRVTPGTYQVTQILVPIGVSMVADSRSVILNYSGTAQGQSESGLIELKSGSRANGNQTISGFTIKGNKLANGGVIVDNRDNVNISNIAFDEFTFYGAWVKNSTNSHIFNNSFFNCSWSSTGWASAEIQIMDIDRCSIHHNTARTDKQSEGYFIKAIGSKTPKGGVLANLSIYSNNADMWPSSNWQNGQAPNIGIELHDVTYAGIEIFDENVRNTMSLASHVPSKAGTRTIVRDNRFNMKNGAYCVELVCSNITIINNTFNGASMITANYNPNSQSNGHWTDQIFENNTVNASGPPPGWGGTFLLGMGGADMIIRNNIFNNVPTSTRIKHSGGIKCPLFGIMSIFINYCGPE